MYKLCEQDKTSWICGNNLQHLSSTLEQRVITPQLNPSNAITRGAATSSKLGVQFLGPGYYYPSREKIRSTQFGAVGYIITLYSSKSYVNSWGVRPNFGEVRTLPPTPPLVAPMAITQFQLP